MTPDPGLLDVRVAAWRRHGVALEWCTLAWNVVGVVVLTAAASGARSTALAAFAADSLIEIGASTVVLWELRGVDGSRRRRGLQLIAVAFAALAAYLTVQSTAVLVTGQRAGSSGLGVTGTAVTVVTMLALAFGKRRAGAVTGNPVMTAEARVTFIDATVAVVVLAGTALNAVAGWWSADPVVALVVAVYAVREARTHWHEAQAVS